MQRLDYTMGGLAGGLGACVLVPSPAPRRTSQQTWASMIRSYTVLHLAST